MRFGALAVLCLGCTSKPAPAAAVVDQSLTARLSRLDALLAAQQQFPGLVAAVVGRDGIVWSKAYGVRDLSTHAPVELATEFRIGSITKVFTALAVLQLRDQGKLDLDARVATWIPELATVTPTTTDSPPITAWSSTRCFPIAFFRLPTRGPGRSIRR